MQPSLSQGPPPRPSPCAPQPFGGCAGLMERVLQGARRSGLKEWMLQMPHRGGLVGRVVPMAGSGGLMERMLQEPQHFGRGALELGVLAAQPPCRTSWFRRALEQGTCGGSRRRLSWRPHQQLVVVAPAAALHWPMRSALRALTRADQKAASNGRQAFGLVHPYMVTPRRRSCRRLPQWSPEIWPPSPSCCGGPPSR